MKEASGKYIADSLDDSESDDVESEDWASYSRMDATVLSCNNFLLLSTLLLLKVASISKSRGTKLPVGDLCIQNTDRNNGYPIQEENKYESKANIHK